MKFPDNAYYEKLRAMTLPELEQFIKTLCVKSKSEYNFIHIFPDNYEETMACLHVRWSKMKEIFDCTPENIERLHRMAILVKNRTEMLRKKGNQLLRQMYQTWQANENEDFTDFYVELQMTVSYNCEDSILYLPDDNSGSDYHFMSEVLNAFYYEEINSGFLIFDDDIDYDEEKDEQKDFDWLKSLRYGDDEEENTWGESRFFEKFPELKKLPFTWEFHRLMFHSYYSMQDIMRINDIWSDAKVVWQHIEGQETEQK